MQNRFTWHLEMKFPKNVPALCKRCCCGSDSNDKIAISQNGEIPMIPRSASVQDVRSHMRLESESIALMDKEVVMDCELPTIVISPSYSAVFAHERRPTDRLSFLSDERYVIDDSHIAGAAGNEVEVASLRTLSAPITIAAGSSVSADCGEKHTASK